MEIIEKRLLEREKKLKYPTDRLGVGALLSMSNKTNASRLIMVNNHMSHAVNIINPEPAKVSTGFEAPISKFSAMWEESDDDKEIIYKIERNIFNYILITYNKKKREFGVINRTEIETHSEEHATRFNNVYLDSLEVGSKIKKGDVIKKSESFDKYGNFCLGKNLNTLYTISTKTMEDGIALMNNAEKMMDTLKSKTYEIHLNENEIMLNLLGGKDEYKVIPEIGEHLKNGILLAIRPNEINSSLYSLKDKHTRRIASGDKIYYGDGIVIDVKVYFNKPSDKLVDSPTHSQINNIYYSEMDYHYKVYTALAKIIRDAEFEGYTYTDELTEEYKRSFDYVDPTALYADSSDNLIQNILLQITVLEREQLYHGSKLAGRSGNKGTICTILSPEESYYTEDGKPIHIIVDALGVVGRLNPSILSEHSLNAEAEIAVEMMKECDTRSDKFAVLKRFFKIVNPEQGESLKAFYKNLPDNEKTIFLKKVERNGIIIVQDPIENCDLTDMMKLYKEFKPKYSKIKFPDKSLSLRKAIVAPQFFIRLKQDPKSKFSARNRGMINPIFQLPSKSNLKRYGLAEFSDVAVRLGSSELDVLHMCNRPEAIADFMAENSTSTIAKEYMSERYLADLDDNMLLDLVYETTKKNRQLIDSRLYILGNRLVFEYEDEE